MRRMATVLVAVLAAAACGSSAGGSTEAFCASVRKFADFPTFFNPRAPDFDAAFTARQYINAMADEAPGEVRSDAETVVKTVDEVAEAGDAVDPADEEAALGAFAPVFDAAADSEFSVAIVNVNEFAMAECDIDLAESFNGHFLIPSALQDES